MSSTRQPIRVSASGEDVRGPTLLASASELTASIDGAVPVFLLIDPMVKEPLPSMPVGLDEAETQQMREEAWQRRVLRVPLSNRIPLPVYQHPYLVMLEGHEDSLLELTLQLAHEERTAAMADGLDGEGASAHRIGGWLQTRQPVASLAGELAEILRVRTLRFTNATYLRLADRRVLAILRHVVGDRRIVGNVQSLERWIYLDVLGSLSLLNGGDGDPERLRLEGNEWDRIERGEGINRTVSQWRGEIARVSPGQTAYESVQELYSKLEIALQAAEFAARQFPPRFPTLVDRTVYAALNLLYPYMANCRAAAEFLREPGSPAEPPEAMRYLCPQMTAVLSAARSSSD